MKEFLTLLAYVLIAMAIGFSLALGFRCALSLYHGGTADPRCVYGLDGYVEIRVLGATPAQDRVSCEYRPEVGRD